MITNNKFILKWKIFYSKIEKKDQIDRERERERVRERMRERKRGERE